MTRVLGLEEHMPTAGVSPCGLKYDPNLKEAVMRCQR